MRLFSFSLVYLVGHFQTDIGHLSFYFYSLKFDRPNPIASKCTDTVSPSYSISVHWLLRMHEEVKCFNRLPVKIQLEQKSSKWCPTCGLSELFRKFSAAEEYSEVAKMFRRVEDQNDSLEVFLLGRALGTLQWRR